MKRYGYLALTAVALWALLTLTGCSSLFKEPAPAVAPSPRPGKRSTSAPHPQPPAGSAGLAVYATGSGGPAAGVLVYAEPLDARASHVDDPPAVLDIMEHHFEPAVLPVQVGGTVTIQNLDTVAHDIYSFSHARSLSLHLAPGERVTGVNFRHSGVVAIGCKIYNDMQGYIYVTTAPYYGVTDSNGYVRLGNLYAGHYRIGAWLPGTSDATLSVLPHTLVLKASSDDVVHIRVRATHPARSR